MLSKCFSSNLSTTENGWDGYRLEKLKKHMLTDEKERFGRLLITWHEVKPDGRRLIHDYAACMDTHEWQIYIDCRPRKIFAKCLGQLLLRPLHAMAKTICHLSMIPIAFEVQKTLSNEQSWHTCLKNSVCSLADIVRTPLYSLVLIVTSLAVCVIGLGSAEFAYEGRSLIGKIEQRANWGEKHTWGTLAPCFQPFSLDILNAIKYSKRNSDTIYPDVDEVEICLANFARNLVRFQRTNRNIFNCCIRLDKNIEYVSSILDPV